ncbi:MAG: BA14K family protein, partial [Phycisphaerae bacterium]|nr:BA14K family protein [Phycisphaerae bacterium]NIU07725.1 BA14K family protein [Phycisphaerae bacterium]
MRKLYFLSSISAFAIFMSISPANVSFTNLSIDTVTAYAAGGGGGSGGGGGGSG